MSNKTIFELQEEIKGIDKHLQRKYETLQYLKEENTEEEKLQGYMNNIKEYEVEKADLLQQMQKINKGKNINIDHNGEYDRHILTVIFPEGASKQFKRQWLLYNNLPICNGFNNINSQYDCTGEVTKIIVDYKKNKVVITKLFDL